MSAGVIVVIIVAILIIIAVAIAVPAARRRRLRQRFGPEYDRMVAEQQSQRKAEAELASRERRVRKLDIRHLSPEARTAYLTRWASIQEHFVDQPAEAVGQAQELVTSAMQERGSPTEDFDQTLADLSVEHARTLEHYRAAHAISETAANGSASTEDLRQAMIHYRAMFDELLGDDSVPNEETAGTSPASSANAAADGTEQAPSPNGAVASDAPASDSTASDSTVDDSPSARRR
jgi:hypothetical protein